MAELTGSRGAPWGQSSAGRPRLPRADRRGVTSAPGHPVRLPKDVAFGAEVELVIVRSGDVLTIYPAVSTLAFDDAAATAYGAIVAQAGSSRRKPLDRMIAAHALVHRATLVTLNADDFTDIVGLALLAW